MSSSSHSFRFLLGVMLFCPSFLVLFCCCVLFVCYCFFFVKYLVCANRLNCLWVSQDYLGAGEKNRGLALAALATNYNWNILNKSVYPKQWDVLSFIQSIHWTNLNSNWTHVARENALDKAASGFSLITCSDSLSSAAEASLCRRGAGEKEKGKRGGTMGRGKTGS